MYRQSLCTSAALARLHHQAEAVRLGHSGGEEEAPGYQAQENDAPNSQVCSNDTKPIMKLLMSIHQCCLHLSGIIDDLV